MSQHDVPVDKFFQVIDAETGVISGYAAPRSGAKPCVVELVTGETVIAVSRASRFSPAAQAIGLRLGWCGFHLAVLPVAAALAGRIALRCAATQAVLHDYDRNAIPSLSRATRPALSASSLISELRLANGTSDLAHVMPFILKFAVNRNNLELIDALYRYFSGRPVDASGRKTWTEAVEGGMDVLDLVETLRDLLLEDAPPWRAIFQGPFEPGFPFGSDVFA